MFDYEDVNTFIIQVSVSDGLLEDMETLTVHITDVNEQPVLVNLPSTVNIAEHHIGYVFDVDAVDQEGTTLIYSMKSYPSSGDLLFNIAPSGRWIMLLWCLTICVLLCILFVLILIYDIYIV